MKLTDITISSNEYRPCYINGKKALFHRWYEFAKPIPPAMMDNRDTGGQMSYTLGLVEYNDGQVAEVHPSLIKFCDSKVNQYYFDEDKKLNLITEGVNPRKQPYPTPLPPGGEKAKHKRG